jgi:predicted HAD superfamily Cof-like phosphohydrolase
MSSTKTNINRVQEFHDVSGLEYRTEPGIPTSEKIDLRLDLLQEELNELTEAAYKKDIVEVLDALVDLQYILHGAILDFGLQEVFEEAEREVHESNMSKFCSNTEEARQSVFKYQAKDIEAYYKLVKGKFVIRRSMDEKVLKGLHFKSPRLKELLEKLKPVNV